MRKVLATLLTLVTLVLVLAVPASATPPTNVSGTWRGTQRIGEITFTPRGKNACVIEGDWGMMWSGDISGTGQNHIRIISHGPCADENGNLYPKGSFMENLHYTGSFYGTVQGREGSFEFVQQVKFTPVDGGTAEAPDFDVEGHMTILSSASGLEGLRGVLTLAGSRRDSVGSLTYEGKIHFHPE